VPRSKKPPLFLGDPSDPGSLSVLLEAWLIELEARNYSSSTVYSRKRGMQGFFAWCDERSLARASDITRRILEMYQQALFHYRKPDNQPLSFISQRQRLQSVKLFFQWLARKNYLVNNPASEIEMPRVERRLPKFLLTAQEADLIIAQPDVGDALGLRDRAVLELLYSTGMRRAELCRLELFDLDADRGTILLRQGKGKKDRVVPVGERACRWLAKYVADVRPILQTPESGPTLFLTHTGEPIKPDFLSTIVRRALEASGIQKKGACHLFRHAMATLMLENGADIRFIQQMLGHASLETTQMYTHVSIRKLKQIHSATHPSAKWQPSVEPDEAGDELVDNGEPERPLKDNGEPDERYNRRRRELNRLFSPVKQGEL